MYQMVLNKNGVCSLESRIEDTAKKTTESKDQYQLLASSRYSFFGCWLHMESLPNHFSSPYIPSGINKSHKKRWLFIYRDSLTAQGFSQLSHVIRILAKLS